MNGKTNNIQMSEETVVERNKEVAKQMKKLNVT